MPKIVFVRQSRPHYEVNYTHPLGLMSLAAYLRETDLHEVVILDNRIEEWPMDELVRRTLAEKPDLVGLTGLTLEAPIVYDFSRCIRKSAPDVMQIAGGIHATSFGPALLSDAPIDVVVKGEGEISTRLVVNALTGSKDLSDINGVAWRKDGEICDRDGRHPVPDLDALPFAAWDLIPVKKYFGKRMGDLFFSRPELMSLYTSRSCPYHCIYCHNLFGRGFRARSAQKVFDEISILYRDYGIREFHIQDDIFNLDIERAKEICRKIVAAGFDLVMAFPNGLRGDIMDDELIGLLHHAGARRIAYAVESAAPRIQGMILKRLDLAKLADTVKKTAAKGILVKGFFMVGFPGETLEEMRTTIRYAREHEFDVANFSRVIPTKGTELFEMVKAAGKIAEFDYEHYAYDYSDINLSAVDDKTFDKTIRRGYLLFVASPSRLLRLIRLFPNKKQIFPYYFILLLIKLFRPKRAVGSRSNAEGCGAPETRK